MNISIIICYIIIILELLNAVWCLYRAVKYKIFYIANKENENIKINKKDSNIIIVIPCLREQDIIIQTIKHFLKITNDFNTVKLLIVTTQKEEYERKKSLYLEKQFIEDIKNNIDIHKLISKYNKLLSTNEIKDILSDRNKEKIEDIIHKKISCSKSTNEVVREFINRNNLEKQVYLFHYPKNEGIMADQLNYVLNNFNFIDEEKYYFSIYNADSIPSKETIKDIIDTINKNNYPKVIQQYSVPLSNWNELSNIMKGFAIYQANFELRYGLINSHFPNKFLYTYVVGHGMYVRVDILKKIGGFETKYWCEDIYMSYVLRNEVIPIYSIGALEIMQSPQYLSILTKQNAVWFKTSFECLKIFRDVYKKNKKLNFSSLGWIIQRIRMNLTWLFLPVAFGLTIIISILNKNIYTLVISILTYFVMILLEYGSIIKIIENLEKFKFKNKIKLLYGTILAVSISNIGPLYSLISRKKEKYKTVR